MLYNLLKFCKVHHIKHELELSSSHFMEWRVRRQLLKILRYALASKTSLGWARNRRSQRFLQNTKFNIDLVTNGSGTIISIRVRYYESPLHYVTTKFSL